MKIDLLTSDADYHSIFELVETKRSTVKVSRDLLNNLLIDYGVMYRTLKGSSQYQFTEPRVRPRLKDT